MNTELGETFRPDPLKKEDSPIWVAALKFLGIMVVIIFIMFLIP